MLFNTNWIIDWKISPKPIPPSSAARAKRLWLPVLLAVSAKCAPWRSGESANCPTEVNKALKGCERRASCWRPACGCCWRTLRAKNWNEILLLEFFHEFKLFNGFFIFILSASLYFALAMDHSPAAIAFAASARRHRALKLPLSLWSTEEKLKRQRKCVVNLIVYVSFSLPIILFCKYLYVCQLVSMSQRPRRYCPR